MVYQELRHQYKTRKKKKRRISKIWVLAPLIVSLVVYLFIIYSVSSSTMTRATIYNLLVKDRKPDNPIKIRRFMHTPVPEPRPRFKSEVSNLTTDELVHTWCKDLRWYYPLRKNFSYETTNWTEIFNGTKPINRHPYKYIFCPSETCQSRENITILSVVKSKASNWKLRDVIRKTWGKEAKQEDRRLVFLLGYSPRNIIKKAIEYEVKTYNDIIQETFIENYYQNTIKTVMGIRWIAQHCNNSRFVFLVDDDVMVMYHNVVKFYQNITESREKYLYSGNLKAPIIPIRKQKHYKWPISEKEYPYDCYPPFLSGGAILTSGFVMKLFAIVIPYIKSFKYDDVYLAIIAQKLGIFPQHNHHVNMFYGVIPSYDTSIAHHGFKNYTRYLNIYRNITNTIS